MCVKGASIENVPNIDVKSSLRLFSVNFVHLIYKKIHKSFSILGEELLLLGMEILSRNPFQTVEMYFKLNLLFSYLMDALVILNLV